MVFALAEPHPELPDCAYRRFVFCYGFNCAHCFLDMHLHTSYLRLPYVERLNMWAVGFGYLAAISYSLPSFYIMRMETITLLLLFLINDLHSVTRSFAWFHRAGCRMVS